MKDNIVGKTIIITGANSGIGKAAEIQPAEPMRAGNIEYKGGYGHVSQNLNMPLMLLSFLGILNLGILWKTFRPNIVAAPLVRATLPKQDIEIGIVEASGMPLRSGSSSAASGPYIDPGEMERKTNTGE